MTEDSKVVAVIPARAGSKRVPRKNVIDFLGLPMLAWTIKAARESGVFAKVLVTTDDQEIADVAMRYGAECPFLRTSKADDFTPVSEATIFALRQMERQDMFFETVVQLFSVCPLRRASDIRRALKFHRNHGRGFTVSCSRFPMMNPWWAFSMDEQGRGSWIHQDALTSRSQDLPPLFCPSGAIWIGNIEKLYQENTFYGKDHVYFEMDWVNAIDIDTPEELELARRMAKIYGIDSHAS